MPRHLGHSLVQCLGMIIILPLPMDGKRQAIGVVIEEGALLWMSELNGRDSAHAFPSVNL